MYSFVCFLFVDYVNYFVSFWYKFVGCYGYILLGFLFDCLKFLLVYIVFLNFCEIFFLLF